MGKNRRALVRWLQLKWRAALMWIHRWTGKQLGLPLFVDEDWHIVISNDRYYRMSPDETRRRS